MKTLLIALLVTLPALARADEAEALYNQTCVACHGPDGKGAIPGTPDFNKADSPLHHKDEATLARSILDGFQSPGSSMAMPPRGGMPSLTEEQAVALVRFLHARFGGNK
ncbi:MAG: cytochrome c [Nevskiales bacterium]|nr:cytochrome c [Nevskiales bacterium]